MDNLIKDHQIVQIRVTRGAMVNYCYLIIDAVSRHAVVIDPAWEMIRIKNIVEKNQAKLLGVLVTHHHFDHIHLARELANCYDCDIHISQIEHDFYHLVDDRMVLFQDRDSLELGSISIMPLVTPGHTAGSTCFLVNKNLFTGDTLFNEGCGTCSSHGADPAAMYSSLQTLKSIIPDDMRIYPGHRYYSELGLTFGEIKKKNIYLQIDNEYQFSRFRMRKAQKSVASF